MKRQAAKKAMEGKKAKMAHGVFVARLHKRHRSATSSQAASAAHERRQLEAAHTMEVNAEAKAADSNYSRRRTRWR